MEFLRELFTQPLSFDEFSRLVNEKGYKLADLSRGEHVAKGKLTEALEKNKSLTENIEKLNRELAELQESNASAEEYRSKLEELQADIKAKEEQARLEAEDKELTDAIMEAIGDRVFTSDYTKNGVIADIKAEIAKKENKSKSYSEIFQEVVKDKDGIFANPNPPAPMPGMGDIETNASTDAMRAVMGLSPIKE